MIVIIPDPDGHMTWVRELVQCHRVIQLVILVRSLTWVTMLMIILSWHVPEDIRATLSFERQLCQPILGIVLRHDIF